MKSRASAYSLTISCHRSLSSSRARVICLTPRGPGEIVGPRRLSDVVVRPLNLTVTRRAHIDLLGRVPSWQLRLLTKFLFVLAQPSTASAAGSFARVVSLTLRFPFYRLHSCCLVITPPPLRGCRSSHRDWFDRNRHRRDSLVLRRTD